MRLTWIGHGAELTRQLQANRSINRFGPLPQMVFPTDACGCRARGLEREVRAPERHRKKKHNSKSVADGPRAIISGGDEATKFKPI
jgi:hypothetical protein